MVVRDSGDALAVVIPAAGRSSRMGRPKALLDPGGVTFLERVVGANRDAGCGIVIVAVRDRDDPIAERAGALGAYVAISEDPDQGPIESLRAGLRALPDHVGRCLLHPVDHPLVRPETISMLAGEADADAKASIVLPLHRGRAGHPVLFKRAVFPELLDRTLAGGARTVVRRNAGRVLAVDVQDPGVLANLDTPEELARRFPGFDP
jgi:molybdenum cofactor cytidylyltransferase